MFGNNPNFLVLYSAAAKPRVGGHACWSFLDWACRRINLRARGPNKTLHYLGVVDVSEGDAGAV